MATTTDDDLNLTQAARYLGVSRPVLRDLVERGLIPAARLTEKVWKVRRADLDAYRRKCTTGTTGEKQ